MKFNRWFILFVVVFLALVFVAEYRMPRKFQWVPTFSHTDKQPFGCYVFDSILSASLLQDYEVTNQTFYQMKGDKRKRCIMVVAESMGSLGKVDTEELLSLAEKGNKILLVCGGYGNGILDDTLQFNYTHSYQSLSLRDYVMKGFARDTVEWLADLVYPRRHYYFYPQMIQYRIRKRGDSIRFKELATIYHRGDSTGIPLMDAPSHTVVSFPVGKGAVIVATTPLLFTNYGILDKPNHEYIFRILSQIGDLPIVRTEAYTPTTAQKEQSPLRYFLSQPPLRWAVILAFLTVLVFMIFTAKRRQRIIPEVEKPKNRNLEFVRLIGTLYYQKRDYRDLVLKKYAYFSEEMRRVLHVDLTDRSEDLRSFAVIAAQTGVEEQDISKLVDTMRRLEEEEESTVSRKTMESLINQITTIWKRTNQEPTSPSSQRR
ncbi:MAG: DUF4350 domain-containing protein [Prevotella sp.]|nr:DUF4350 domain-containing protein [Prevotella sp.]